jgi:hypothetical protein
MKRFELNFEGLSSSRNFRLHKGDCHILKFLWGFVPGTASVSCSDSTGAICRSSPYGSRITACSQGKFKLSYS